MTTPLSSWNDGAAKRAIVGFVNGSVREGPDFITPADRIATFDNDGTLWVEQPAPPQFDFLLRKWTAEAQADPSLATQQPYKAIVDVDPLTHMGLEDVRGGAGPRTSHRCLKAHHDRRVLHGEAFEERQVPHPQAAEIRRRLHQACL